MPRKKSVSAAFKGEPRIVVIGAGVSGILMGVKLRERGFRSFRILEKGAIPGGTWRDNRYPGLTCDVPSHCYVYSFAPNPDWTHRYATAKDILEYYTGIARKYGVTPHITCNREVLSADWDGSAWRLKTNTGEEIVADILISAVGRLHHPKMPDIPGLGSFEGPCFHSAQWDDSVQTAGKRLGIIGTGSTSAQITSALVDEAASISVFQRTPHWVLNMPNYKISPALRWFQKLVPGAAKWYYEKLSAEAIERGRKMIGDAEARKFRSEPCYAALETIKDPVLRKKITPDYEPGCKRMVISDKYHEAIQKPNVDVVVDGIERIEPKGVRTVDGKLHELDVLVLATGFKADAFMRPMTMTGRNGVKLDNLWSEGFLNYRSVAMPEMPNFFLLNGPYSPSGNNPIVAIVEIQAKYVGQLIDEIVERGVAISPSMERTKTLLEQIRERAKQTVWYTAGCKSWYLDASGVPIINPISNADMAVEMAVPDLNDFEVEPLKVA